MGIGQRVDEFFDLYFGGDAEQVELDKLLTILQKLPISYGEYMASRFLRNTAGAVSEREASTFFNASDMSNKLRDFIAAVKPTENSPQPGTYSQVCDVFA